MFWANMYLLVDYFTCVGLDRGLGAKFHKERTCAALRDTVTRYIIVRHTAVHSPNHHNHPTDFEPDWMSLKPSNLGSQASVWVLALRPGGNMFSGGRSLDWSYWFSADGGQGCSQGFRGPAPRGSLQGEKGGVGHSCCLESCRQTLGQSFNLH